ncbi:MAG: PilZ domain-containing protein [Anaerolineae bacterium]|jgi:hypothetical protein|nr:PilZ domain-containing protein [Anaerolineae bacterium]MBT7070068.1 PilZ domain-containing protein [Anaerolineae bacterium]MBT7323593.1 PilZ domain-containing protein [Anaerolineae bacterium]
MSDKRGESRKSFSYYMQLTDATTKELVGHLSDISTGGFKLDCEEPIPLEKEYRLHLALTTDVASKPFMIFSARSKWCQSDPIDPFVYNVGFHLIEMHPEDREIFTRVVELYGSEKTKRDTHTNPSRSKRWW